MVAPLSPYTIQLHGAFGIILKPPKCEFVKRPLMQPRLSLYEVLGASYRSFAEPLGWSKHAACCCAVLAFGLAVRLVQVALLALGALPCPGPRFRNTCRLMLYHTVRAPNNYQYQVAVCLR